MDLRRISTSLTREQKLAVVSIADVKAQVRVSHSEEDELIAVFIEAAYDYLSGPEGWLGHCCLLDEEFEVYSAGPDRYGFELPMRPIKEGAAIVFDYLANATYTPVAPESYFVGTTGVFPRVHRIVSSRAWPYVGIRNPRAYRLRFVAGFGAAADIPSPIKLGIRMLAAHWYQNRETVGSEGRTVGGEIEYGLKALCGRYRIAHDHS
ncbi:head-tail connector protein [Microvirga massiliensis]|uniref:head-tail connector protein n=1 Tax=Microvirga massiliensis TaxID=1033741 RepID=UPI0006613969|nr:head-tail connector protein [Microvirga massiliensis]